MRKKRIYKVKDCFEFVCPNLWEKLEKTKDTNIRSCNNCEKKVYKATTIEKMNQLANEGKCVAFYEYEMFTIGLVMPPEFNLDPKPEK